VDTELKLWASAFSSSEQQPVSKIARDLGVSPGTLRNWVSQAEIDGDQREGLTTEERQELSRLRREVKLLREEQEILKSGGGFSQREPFDCCSCLT
jgi:transposase